MSENKDEDAKRERERRTRGEREEPCKSEGAQATATTRAKNRSEVLSTHLKTKFHLAGKIFKA